jgi:hypothetical protein
METVLDDFSGVHAGEFHDVCTITMESSTQRRVPTGSTRPPIRELMIGIVPVSRWTATVASGRICHDDVGFQADQLLRERSYPIDVRAGPPQGRILRHDQDAWPRQA